MYKFHLNIIHGDCVSLESFKYTLILMDVATRYTWFFVLKSITSACIIAALEDFRAEAGHMPRRFQTDFDEKLIGGAVLRWLQTKESPIIAAPYHQQSSNRLSKRQWRIIVSMSHAYLTRKQVSRDYWFFAYAHIARMSNCVPGCI